MNSAGLTERCGGCYKILFHQAAFRPAVTLVPGSRHGAAAYRSWPTRPDLKGFRRNNLDARDCSSTWGTVPSGCAYNPDYSGFLPDYAGAVFQAIAESDGGARSAHGGSAQGRRSRGSRRSRKGEAVSGSAEKGARAGIHRAGSGTEKVAGRARGAAERGTEQGGSGSSGRQGARG